MHVCVFIVLLSPAVWLSGSGSHVPKSRRVVLLIVKMQIPGPSSACGPEIGTSDSQQNVVKAQGKEAEW